MKKDKAKNDKLNLGGKLDTPGSSRDYQTGDWRNKIPMLDKSKCIDCGDCVSFCPEDCIIVKDKKISHIDYKYCKGCGVCAKECKQGCFKMKDV